MDDAREADQAGKLNGQARQFLNRLNGARQAAVVESDVYRLMRVALGVAIGIHALGNSHDHVSGKADRDRICLVLRDVKHDIDVVQHRFIVIRRSPDAALIDSRIASDNENIETANNGADLWRRTVSLADEEDGCLLRVQAVESHGANGYATDQHDGQRSGQELEDRADRPGLAEPPVASDAFADGRAGTGAKLRTGSQVRAGFKFAHDGYLSLPN